MKSYVQYLQGLYKELLVAASEAFPYLQRDCERDSSRLLSLIESRGLSFLMIDLPDMGKHFDRSLANGRLIRSSIPGQRAYKTGGVIPRLFKGMLLSVFDENGVLRTVPDVDAIRFLRQLYYAAKKMKVACSDSKTWKHVNEFFETDREVRLPSLRWDEDELCTESLGDLHIGDCLDSVHCPLFDDSPDVQSDESRSEHTLAITNWERDAFETVQRTADIVAATLGRFNPTEWRTKHGPGAVADQRHTQFKYDFPTWPAKLDRVFPMSEFGFANYDHWVDFITNDGAQKGFSPHEPPSKLICVPKTLKGPRLIASEPVSHQWCQQTILDYLVSRLDATPIRRSIHFRDQTKNQEAALRASHTQDQMTIDLSSASDRLSCWVVERIFRRNESLVGALHASRTRWVVNTIDRKSPQYSFIRKFACMGSACTFPVQSYVFAILAVSSVLYVRNLRPSISNIMKVSQEVLVFGDDIIVALDAGEVLQAIMGHLGLKVNHNKTYGTGRFRESCGVDAYDGNDVTPTYSIARPDVSRPESVISAVETHNNFAKRRLFRVCDYIESTVRRMKNYTFPYVPAGSGTLGWYDHSWKGNSHLKTRWNPLLQRVEYRISSAKAVSEREPTGSNSMVLQFFTEVLPFDWSKANYLRPGERLGVPTRPATRLCSRWVGSVL
jgi:hypothetical protein